MNRVLVLFLFILVVIASPALANSDSVWFNNWEESPSGFGNGSSLGSGSGSVSSSVPPWVTDVFSSNGLDSFKNQANQAFESFEVPWWIKVMEVEIHGKASPFYDEVMKR